MRKLRLLFYVMSLVPTCAWPQTLPHSGATLADDETAVLLERTVAELAAIHGQCKQLGAIRIEPIPRDFHDDPKFNGFLMELWTAIGCDQEFPIWVAWRQAPRSGGVIQMAGLYKWGYKAPQ